MAISIDATFTGEPSLALLIGLALVFRIAGGVPRATDSPLGRLVGWLLCAVAAWLVAAAAGAFAPIGLALLLGLLFLFLDHFARRAPVWALGEIAVVVACGWMSIPALAWRTMALTAAAVAIGGAVVDRIVAPLPRAASSGDAPLRAGEAAASPSLPARLAVVACALLPVWLWIGHGLAFPAQRAEFLQQKWPQIRPALGPFFAIARARVGEPVELPGGAIGWLTLPNRPPPYHPALLFHGADEEGAYQRGALFLRRVLNGLGYAVLAVDAPGFAASAPPAPLDELDAWDPEPLSMAAARWLESRPDVSGSVLAVGHSMGATRALRFIDVWPGASAAVVLGATVFPPPSEDGRIYERFLDDFDLETSGLSREFVHEVRRRYFNNDDAARRLREGHAPVLFLRFAYDYANIIAGRNELFAEIPGRKLQWELRSDHQFISSRVEGVLTGNWQVMRRLEIAIGRFVVGRAPRGGRKLGFTPRR
ncbi:MAG: alpha/beta fold hydrolase [Acidobacteriota bacterium]